MPSISSTARLGAWQSALGMSLEQQLNGGNVREGFSAPAPTEVKQCQISKSFSIMTSKIYPNPLLSHTRKLKAKEMEWLAARASSLGLNTQPSTSEEAQTSLATCHSSAHFPRRHFTPPVSQVRVPGQDQHCHPLLSPSLLQSQPSGPSWYSRPCRRLLGQKGFPASRTLPASTNRFLSYTHAVTHTGICVTDHGL